MPARVRRKQLFPLLVAALVVLATSGTAAAANGGFTPVAPNSPNADKIRTTYDLVLGFTAFIFVLVEGLLVVFAVRYRSRGRLREVEGAQVHGHTRLELIWTASPIVILAVIAAFVFSELPGIDRAPAATDPIHITLEGHQFYWQFDYPNGAHSINDLHVPVGQVVDLRVVSGDVIHSWWIPALGGKIQAIPGRTNHSWFEATRAGTFQGQCAELCGLYHASMLGRVVVESASDYHTFVTKTAPATLGRQIFTGVCATCHGMEGQGGYGPVLSSSPLLQQKSSLVQIVRHGQDTSRPGIMPPVGSTWSNQEIDALAAYVSKHVYKGASTSGG
jgi:cytochrome c oxidase subunit 2